MIRSEEFSSGAKSEHGFSMLEVLVSLVLFGLFCAGMLPTFQNFMRHITSSQLRTEAVSVATRRFDQLREETPDSMPTSGTVGPMTIQGGRRSFDVFTVYCENSTFCPSSRTRHVKVLVQYKGEGVYSAETVYTRLR